MLQNEFETMRELEIALEEYAASEGFAIRAHDCKPSAKLINAGEIIKNKSWKCSKSGNNTVGKCKCPVKINAWLNAHTQRYRVTSARLEHNHELDQPNSKKRKRKGSEKNNKNSRQKMLFIGESEDESLESETVVRTNSSRSTDLDLPLVGIQFRKDNIKIGLAIMNRTRRVELPNWFPPHIRYPIEVIDFCNVITERVSSVTNGMVNCDNCFRPKDIGEAINVGVALATINLDPFVKALGSSSGGEIGRLFLRIDNCVIPVKLFNLTEDPNQPFM